MPASFNPSFHTYDNRTESQISSIAAFAERQGGSPSHGYSFVILPETVAEEGGLETSGRQRKISHLKAELLHVKDLYKSEAMRTRLINAMQRGLVGFQLENNHLALPRKCADKLSKAKVSVTALRRRRTTHTAPEKGEPVKKQKKHEELPHTKEETSQASSLKKAKPEPQENIDYELDKDVVEVKSYISFDGISDEDYARFWLQFNKISTIADTSEKETSADASTDVESSVGAAVIKAKAKSTTRLTLAKHLLESAHHYSGTDKETDRMAKRIIKKEIRFLADLEKDALAAKKLRDFIRADLTKAEIKSTFINRASKADREMSKASLDKIVKDAEITEAALSDMLEINEINEAALNKMLENNEITEDAMYALLKSKSIDEKFLKNLLAKELISKNAYKLFIKLYLR